MALPSSSTNNDDTIDKKQETRNKKQETRNKKQETRNKKQENSQYHAEMETLIQITLNTDITKK